MIHMIINLLEQYGYPMLFLFMLTGIVGIPWPLEFLLFFSSSLAISLRMNHWMFLLLAWLGALLGMLINYEIGKRLGISRIGTVTRWFRISDARLDKFLIRFRRAGVFLIFLGFFVTGLRHLTPILSGASRMWISA